MRGTVSTACAPSQSAPFQAQPPHGKRNGAASGDKGLCAVGDHAAAILCGVSRLSFPRCRIVVLCGNVEAKEGRRPGSSARLHAAQLITVTPPSWPGLTRLDPAIHVFLA